MQSQNIFSKFGVGRAVLLAATLLAATVAALVGASEDHSKEPNVVGMMTRLQHFMHRVGIAIHANNFPLTHFYMHEAEAVLKEVEEVEIFHGSPIGKMAEDIFAPAFHELEEAVETRDPEAAMAAYYAALGKCNECHQGASRDYIVIEYRGENLPLQNFAPR